jgi:hypothetical protein
VGAIPGNGTGSGGGFGARIEVGIDGSIEYLILGLGLGRLAGVSVADSIMLSF